PPRSGGRPAGRQASRPKLVAQEQEAMPPTSWQKSPVELVERFAAALPQHPAVVRKPMFGYPAAFANGNMVCGLFQDSVVVRLGKEGAASVVAAGRAQQF